MRCGGEVTAGVVEAKPPSLLAHVAERVVLVKAHAMAAVARWDADEVEQFRLA